MSYKLLNLNNCLWEAYYIDFRKWIRKAIKSASEDEKIQINNKLTLLHLFLLRRKIDPGFYSFVSKQIAIKEKKSPYITRKMDMILSKIFLDNVDGIEDYIYGEWFKSEHRELPKQEIYQNLDDIYQNMKKDMEIPSDLKDKINFLGTRQIIAHEKKDEDESIAISSILTEMEFRQKNNIHNLAAKSMFYTPVSESLHHLLFDESTFYSSLGYTEKWMYLSKKYMLENIHQLDFYFRPSENIAKNFAYFFDEDGFVLLMLEKLLMNGFFDEKKKGKIPSVELIHDITKITHLIWFIEKTEEEMKLILNSTYTFTPDFEVLDAKIEVGGLSSAYSFAELLHSNGFLNQSKMVYQYLQKEDNSPRGQYLCYWNLGKIALMKNEPENSNKLFLKSLKLLNKYFNDKHYDVALTHLKLYEAKSMLNQQDKAYRHLSDCDQVASKLKNDEGVRFYRIVTDTCRKAFDFENERLYLSKTLAIKNNGLKEKEIQYFNKRLLELKSYDFENEKQKSCQAKNEELFSMANSLQDRFQFEEAKLWYSLADRVKEDEDTKLALAILSYVTSDYDIDIINQDSITLFEQFVETYPENVLGHEFLGIIYIANKNKNQGIQEIEKSINLAFKYGISYGTYDYLLPLDYDTNKLLLPTKEVSYEMVIRVLIKELLSFCNKNELRHIIDLIEKYVNVHKKTFYLDIGTAFTDFGFYDEGLEYYLKEREKVKSQNEKDLTALVYNNIGTNYANQNIHDEAIKYYSKALKFKENYASAWRNKASSEGFILNYKDGFTSMENAIKCLDKSHKDYEEKLSFFEKQKDTFAFFAKNVLAFENISEDDDEVRKILKTAESILYKIAQTDDVDEDFDYSLVLLEYGKAIETLLDNHVSAKVRKAIFEDMDNNKKKTFFYKDGTVKKLYYFGNKDKKIHSLPPSLKSLLGKPQKTISLGQWQYVKNDLEIKNNGLIRLVSLCFHKVINCDLDEIAQICDSIYDIRNGSAHKGTKSKEYVLERRSELIENINEAIKLVSNL
ncbi:tetratricopeptide repeat protein [uncultured Methanolobus sp.]|uniref:tetratricopeptide repeat protein n=1 Tax=uncultured Methanolobus sp. TaxID=218300 RepID=UPI002AABB478|nr:tetratricopeptide repeat protein [uncultured Methanolobus sp.]